LNCDIILQSIRHKAGWRWRSLKLFWDMPKHKSKWVETVLPPTTISPPPGSERGEALFHALGTNKRRLVRGIAR
jgi:hypothetical protein